MLAQDVLPYVKAVPFRPFRIRMNSGRAFDIRHPELIRLSRTTAVVFTALDDNDLFDRMEMLGVELIESVSYIDPPVAAQPTGDAGG